MVVVNKYFAKKKVVLLILILVIGASSQRIPLSEGSFVMGDNSGESDELPEHEVTLSSYKIDQHEITYAQYDSCVQSGKCTKAHYDDNSCLVWNGQRFQKTIVPLGYRDPSYPVVCVSWHQAQTFCRSKGMKLPTEAQWEYAARAGERNRYSWGNAAPTNERCPMANNGPESIGSYQPNKWGLYDMTGNVWEWTIDFYEKGYYSISETQNPTGPGAGLYRVIRGGGWYSGAPQLKISNRHWFSPDFSEASLGFRCAN
jgi:formylglycine-generating enzyme required for sulfatase activity